MISLNTWNTLFEGRYGSQELSILYSDDYFVSFLKSREQNDVLVQVYKIFVVTGDIEVFSETLPNQCIVYEKHFDIGEKSTYKFFILNTNTEYVSTNTLSYHVDKKIEELNKKTGSIISIINSYDIRLTSLKLASQKIRNIFFSDPTIVKVLTNMPKSTQLSGITSIDKLLIGLKDKVPINVTLSDLDKILVTGANLDDRLFVSKLISELYLLSSKTVVVFDSKGVFKSLAYPQQHQDSLEEFDPLLGAFGFPYKFFKYFENLKIPLGAVPKPAFISLFNFTGVSIDILNQIYDSSLVKIEDLIKKLENVQTKESITDFEIARLNSKLLLIAKKYDSYFAKTNVSKVFENKYDHLGSSKIIKIDKDSKMYSYYISHLIKEICEQSTKDLLIVLPEFSEVFNNSFIGDELIDNLESNNKINYVITSEYTTDIKKDIAFNIKFNSIKGNDVVLKYNNRDPLRLLLRPTLSSSNISLII